MAAAQGVRTVRVCVGAQATADLELAAGEGDTIASGPEVAFVVENVAFEGLDFFCMATRWEAETVLAEPEVRECADGEPTRAVPLRHRAVGRVGRNGRPFR